MTNNIPFFLITGTMRSGTSMLGSLFHSRTQESFSYPGLCFDNDKLDLLKNTFNKIGEKHNKGFRNATANELYEIINNPNNSFEIEDLNKKSISFPDYIINKIKEHYCNNKCEIIGIKETDLLNEIFFLLKNFPLAKFIITVRDPRDILASNIKRNNTLHRTISFPILSNILNYYYFLESIKDNSNILIVRYEDIVLNPIDKITKILSFLNLDIKKYNWEYVNHIDSNSSYNHTIGDKPIANIGISKNNIGNYKKFLNYNELLFTELITAPYMNKFNYIPDLSKEYVQLSNKDKHSFMFFIQAICNFTSGYYSSSEGINQRLLDEDLCEIPKQIRAIKNINFENYTKEVLKKIVDPEFKSTAKDTLLVQELSQAIIRNDWTYCEEIFYLLNHSKSPSQISILFFDFLKKNKLTTFASNYIRFALNHQPSHYRENILKKLISNCDFELKLLDELLDIFDKHIEKNPEKLNLHANKILYCSYGNWTSIIRAQSNYIKIHKEIEASNLSEADKKRIKKSLSSFNDKFKSLLKSSSLNKEFFFEKSLLSNEKYLSKDKIINLIQKHKKVNTNINNNDIDDEKIFFFLIDNKIINEINLLESPSIYFYGLHFIKNKSIKNLFHKKIIKIL